MKNALVLLIVAAAALIPTTARSANEMEAMGFYVGSWTCVGGDTGQKPFTAAVKYRLDDTILRQWVRIPGQGAMKTYELAATTTWDAKNGRYVQVGLDSVSEWWISYGKVTGATESWTQHMTWNGKLGHDEATRTSETAFTYASYASMGAAKPYFRVVCKKA